MAKTSKPTPDVARYEDGGVRYRGFQLDGEMHGHWEFLRKDGSVMRSGRFERGKTGRDLADVRSIRTSGQGDRFREGSLILSRRCRRACAR